MNNERRWIPAFAGMTMTRSAALKASSRRRPGSSGFRETSANFDNEMYEAS